MNDTNHFDTAFDRSVEDQVIVRRDRKAADILVKIRAQSTGMRVANK